jgi:hypothetical protein
MWASTPRSPGVGSSAAGSPVRMRPLRREGALQIGDVRCDHKSEIFPIIGVSRRRARALGLINGSYPRWYAPRVIPQDPLVAPRRPWPWGFAIPFYFASREPHPCVKSGGASNRRGTHHNLGVSPARAPATACPSAPTRSSRSGQLSPDSDAPVRAAPSAVPSRAGSARWRGCALGCGPRRQPTAPKG